MAVIVLAVLIGVVLFVVGLVTRRLRIILIGAPAAFAACYLAFPGEFAPESTEGVRSPFWSG
jgi:hypothetical protein